jgi:hypothetical protein
VIQQHVSVLVNQAQVDFGVTGVNQATGACRRLPRATRVVSVSVVRNILLTTQLADFLMK